MKIVADLEGMKYPSSRRQGRVHAQEDHQFFQPLFVSDLGPLEAGQTFDEEKTGWGWKPGVLLSAKDTVVPTTCKMKRPERHAGLTPGKSRLSPLSAVLLPC